MSEFIKDCLLLLGAACFGAVFLFVALNAAGKIAVEPVPTCVSAKIQPRAPVSTHYQVGEALPLIELPLQRFQP